MTTETTAVGVIPTAAPVAGAPTFEGFDIIDNNQFSQLQELDACSPGFLKSCADVFTESAQKSLEDIAAAM
jgi:hypothetical protein